MFTKLRQKDIKKVLWVLVIVIVPAFVFWGAAGFFKDKDEKSPVIIFGEKIPTDEFNRFLKNLQVLFYLNFGNEAVQNISPEQWKNIAWQNLLLVKKAQKENIKSTDKETLEMLKQLPLLKRNGKFSKERYLNTFKKIKATPGEFEKFLKNQVKMEKIKDRIFSDIKVTDEEIKQQYKNENEEVKIKYLPVKYQEIKKDINPSDEQLQEYYTKNKKAFRRPEKIKISYILLKNPNSEIMSSVKETIKSGAKLETIAKSLNLELTATDYFAKSSPIKGLGWQKTINQKAFSLEKGHTAGPIHTSEGTVFIQKTGHKKAYTPEFPAIKNEVGEQYKIDKARKKAEEKAEKITDKIESENIEKLSEVKRFFPEMEIKETDFFKRQSFVKEIGLNPVSNQKIFNLQEKEILTDPLSLKKGLYIVQLQELKSIDEDKFRENKEKYRQKLLAAKKNKALTKYLQKLIKQTNSSQQ